MQTENFNLIKAIRSVVNNQPFDNIAKSTIAAAAAELRKSSLEASGQIQFETRATLAAQAANSGIEFVAEDKAGLITPLRSKLVAVEAGATFLEGLTGNISIPSYSGTSALWKGEVAAAEDGAGSTGEVLLSPKRLTTFIKISRMFIAQDSSGANAMLMNDLYAAIADKFESTIWGKEAGNANQPAGLFLNAPTINGAATWANIIALETAVDTANALKTACYITNAAGRALLKLTPKEANMPEYLIGPDGTMNGYPVLASNHIATGLQVGGDEHGIIFGDFSQLVMGQWGAIDLIVDPFSAATTGEIVLTINAYLDAALRIPAAFKTGSLK